jgi:hypothetical protein
MNRDKRKKPYKEPMKQKAASLKKMNKIDKGPGKSD